MLQDALGTTRMFQESAAFSPELSMFVGVS
jgi:hypothetical protein